MKIIAYLFYAPDLNISRTLILLGSEEMHFVYQQYLNIFQF